MGKIVEKAKNKAKQIDSKMQEMEKSYLNNRCDLSKQQKQIIQEKQAEFFGKVTSDDKLINAERLLGSYGVQIYKSYLPFVSDNYTPVFNNSFDMSNRISTFDITRWVIDAEEKNIEKLINVYEALANDDCSIALIFDRTIKGSSVKMAVANLGKTGTPDIVEDYTDRIISAIMGNFPGAIIENDNTVIGPLSCLNNSIRYKKALDQKNEKFNIEVEKSDSVAIITNIPSDKSEDFISQSIEKLLDGIIPKNEKECYKIVLLAQPNRDISSQKLGLFNTYNALAPYASWQSSITAGITKSKGMTSNLTKHLGTYIGSSVSSTTGASVSAGYPGVASASVNESVTVSGNLGASFGVDFGKSANRNVSLTNNETLTDTYTNYGVKHALELLEKGIERIEECSALGMWNFAAYTISESPVVANNVASMYLALTQGEESYLFQPAINFWHGSRKKENAAVIIESVKNMQHPRFILNDDENDDTKLMLPNDIDLCSLISGKELVRSLNFPRKSIVGFPVIECASFGRNVIHYNQNSDKTIQLGNVFHMNKKESTSVDLDLKSLTSHVFITGSTGSGKSNTVYHLLDSLKKDKKKFMVIEPAKGEYKDVFGADSDVSVYGTNPKLTPLLKLNPFSFPEEIQVLEHIDRLVEIFNACWPMYAAMPAVLKDAVERSYVDCGWDLVCSENKFNERIFPTFADVARNIKVVIDTSSYDNENKGAYKGSLLTRLQSLTNGINGLIFSCDEISNEKLFDENVVIDLSRVGSTETKSLIMGMLVLKLQEYRMAKATGNNAELNHITVLEEAHNLLRRTSNEQYADSSNLQGKSVEMIANAIAEMRTYGEGFIIADQAPGLIDMAAIRNTNTKIIMRLPDQSDRELVGRAANLNDEQIREIAKIPCGVAAIYQNNWVEPVLCKISKSSKKYKEYKNKQPTNFEQNDDSLNHSILERIMDESLLKYGDNSQIVKLKSEILRSGLSSQLKTEFLSYINSDEENSLANLRTLVYDFLNAEKAIDKAMQCSDIHNWVRCVVDNLSIDITNYANEKINLIVNLIVYEQSLRDKSYNDIACRYAEVFKAEGGVF